MWYWVWQIVPSQEVWWGAIESTSRQLRGTRQVGIEEVKLIILKNLKQTENYLKLQELQGLECTIQEGMKIVWTFVKIIATVKLWVLNFSILGYWLQVNNRKPRTVRDICFCQKIFEWNPLINFLIIVFQSVAQYLGSRWVGKDKR